MHKDTKFANPLDNLFDVEAGDHNEMAEYEQITEAEVNALAVQPEASVKDAEDIETDGKIDAVYDAALETFQNQMAYTEIIEPRYAARNAEVAANYLNIALAAATSKAKLKTDRKRVNAFIPGAAGARVTNNTIVATREEILRMISVDCEVKELK